MESYKIALIECVLGVKSIAKTDHTWAKEDVAKALSPEALTAAVMQRYHAHQVLKRNINHRIGKSHITV
jgi:hypothetical protein